MSDSKAEKILCLTALILVIVGALNWGLHAFGFNLVDSLDDLFKAKGYLAKIVYVLVAIAGITVAVQLRYKKIQCCCPCSEDDRKSE